MLLVIALAGLTLCGAQPPQKQSDSAQRATHAAQAAKPSSAPFPTVTAQPTSDFTPYPGYDPDPCYHAKNHDTADLCAQWRSAIAGEKAAHEARRSTNWSIVATFLSAISLMAVAVALKLTVDSNRIARQTQSLELRPWVLFAGFSNQFYNHFTFDDVERGKAAQFAIIIKNYGKVPAINAKVKINSAVVPKDFEGFPDLSLPLTGKAVIIGPETATETQPRYIFGDDHVGIFDFSKKVAIAVRCEYTGPRSTEIHKTIIKGFIYLFQVRGDTPTGGQAVFSWDNFSYEQT